uniref:Peptidase M13 C-terminal domain-containing protein n=1 Tax=viral metagenome TaxID=1070528 RepID=A0A6C0IGA2_9ZZZZ
MNNKTRKKIVNNKRDKKIVTNNKTQKKMFMCNIGLKPFEIDFSKKRGASFFNKSEKTKKKDFVKQLLSQFAPNSIKPVNDFYDYINYQWLKDTTLQEEQKYIVQIDDFRLVQDKVYQELNVIILDYIKTHNNRLSKNLKNLYTSVIKMNPKSYSRKIGKQMEYIINDFISKNNPWALLAYINSDEMLATGAPFVWSLNPDDMNPKQFCSYINPHTFTILDINVYYDDGTNIKYKEKYKKEFFKYCKKLFNTVLGPNDYNPEDVFNVEVEIFNSLGCLKVTKQEENIYNKVTTDEALSKYGFDWKEFTQNMGYKKTPPFFVTSSLNYLKCGSELLVKNWNSIRWKTYWVFLLIKRIARFTKDWENITYDFYGDYERGQTKINRSDAVSASLYMSIAFNTFLTNEYVKKYEKPESIEFVRILCNDLKVVFRRILSNNSWLTPKTKKYALEKLSHFKFIIGKPEDLSEDPDLNYSTILYDNMVKIMLWRHKLFIELDGKPVIDIPMMDWTQYPVKMVGTQAYIVNASYTPSKNAIYINLGYIQKPFVDLEERGIEYNLAHLGFTIGHEMSHGFDDMGSKYGWDGKLNDWWTTEDKKKYKVIQDDVIKQYEVYAARDGVNFDASIGIGEDLADISGFAICNEYLRDFQDKNEDLIPIKELSFKVFNVYYALQQRQKVSKKALAAQLKTNPHPLDKYRCNVPLSRSQIFRGLYDVKKGDGMWWHNTNTIW